MDPLFILTLLVVALVFGALSGWYYGLRHPVSLVVGLVVALLVIWLFWELKTDPRPVT